MADSLDVLLGKRFIERRDVKAVQHSSGAYTPERSPWKMSDLRAHLEGSKTFGHYMISPEGNTKLFAFDIDLRKTGYYVSLKEDEIMQGGQPCNPREVWRDTLHPGREKMVAELKTMAECLAMKIIRLTDNEFPVAIAYSGNKGVHVYGFMGTTPAHEARTLAVEVLRAFGPAFEPTKGDNFWQHTSPGWRNLEIEVFPKQDDLGGKDLGNLMRLPLGLNQKSGERGFFVDPRGKQNELKILDPLVALSEGINQWIMT